MSGSGLGSIPELELELEAMELELELQNGIDRNWRFHLNSPYPFITFFCENADNAHWCFKNSKSFQ